MPRDFAHYEGEFDFEVDCDPTCDYPAKAQPVDEEALMDANGGSLSDLLRKNSMLEEDTRSASSSPTDLEKRSLVSTC